MADARPQKGSRMAKNIFPWLVGASAHEKTTGDQQARDREEQKLRTALGILSGRKWPLESADMDALGYASSRYTPTLDEARERAERFFLTSWWRHDGGESSNTFLSSFSKPEL
jgi:hypothetical protein